MGHEEFMSQEEVDALLKGVTGETDSVADQNDRAAVRTYNLATQERIVRGRMPGLEIINDRFARLLRLGIFNFMRRTAEISVGPVKVLKYSEFTRNLPIPTNLNLVHVKPLRGTSLFVFDPDLVFFVVDNLFGGDGRFHTRVEGRDFTADVAEDLVAHCCPSFDKATALANRAILMKDPAKRLAYPLSGHLHQAELGNSQDVGFRLVAA